MNDTRRNFQNEVQKALFELSVRGLKETYPDPHFTNTRIVLIADTKVHYLDAYTIWNGLDEGLLKLDRMLAESNAYEVIKLNSLREQIVKDVRKVEKHGDWPGLMDFLEKQDHE